MSDTGAGGLFQTGSNLVQGWYPNLAPPELAFPFVVTDLVGGGNQHAFNKDIVGLTCRMNVYHEMESESSTDTMNTCSLIIRRLIGNWASASPATAPTYGFHRHPLVVASGDWASTVMSLDDQSEEHTDGIWHFILFFKFYLQR